MSFDDFEQRARQHDRLLRRQRERERRARRRRLMAGGAVALVVVLVAAVALAASGGGSSTKTTARTHHRRGHHHRGRARTGPGSTAPATSTSAAAATGVPGTRSVPILMYHVINPPPAGAPFPGLYVPSGEFAAQMQALKSAGWHAVTMDQMEAYWTRGVPLPAGKPIVITFDNGYASQYTNALPVLKQLGWVGVENIQLSGLPPSQGGLTDAQVHGLLSAGWELDTQGISHADLIALTPSELHDQVATARQILRQRYGVPVNWFCYPSGHYNAAVIAEVKAAGYVGSTTVIPGWAGPHDDPYALPRLRVLGGTSPAALLEQIAQAQDNPPPGGSYGATAGASG